MYRENLRSKQNNLLVEEITEDRIPCDTYK